jgi:hypothetical protein
MRNDNWVFDIEKQRWNLGVNPHELKSEPIEEKVPVKKKTFIKKKTRPNSVCLVCDSPHLKDPTTERPFKYCSKPCSDDANKGLKILSKNVAHSKKKRSGRNSRELCLTYFVLRKWDEPMSSKVIVDNARDLFGDKLLGGRLKDFNNMFIFFSNVRKMKINGKNHYQIIDKSIPFNKSLKPRFNKVVFGE